MSGNDLMSLPKKISMKKSNGIIYFSVFATAFLFSSCSTPAEKVDDAAENVMEAQEDLDDANEDYKEEMKDYRETTANQIAANEKSIEEFNARIANQKKEAKVEYEAKIAELDSQNTDLKKRMDDFQADGKTSWETFKAEFGKDMDALGEAFRDFTIEDEK